MYLPKKPARQSYVLVLVIEVPSGHIRSNNQCGDRPKRALLELAQTLYTEHLYITEGLCVDSSMSRMVRLYFIVHV